MNKILSFFKSKKLTSLQLAIAEQDIDLAAKNLEIESLKQELVNTKKVQTPPTHETVLLYTDKSGVNWFGFKTFEYLPNARRMQYMLATSALELNLTKNELTKYLDTVNKLVFGIETDIAANKSKIVALNERIRERMNLAAYYKVIADLINIFFFIEGENPNEVDEVYFSKKTEILKNDIEARNFFFVLLTQKIYNFKDISDTELLDYLISQVNEKALHLLDLQ